MLDPTQAELDARLEGAVGPVKFALNGKDVITLAILATALGFMLWIFTLFLKDVSESLKTSQLAAAHAVMAAIEKHDRMIEIGNDNARMFTQQHNEVIAACTKPARLLR
jgi:hypothetical protein